MLKELKFVQGAVAKKNFLPAMTHFAIEGGHVRAYNGTLALSSPIPFNIDCKPKASPLIQAIGNCEDTATLSMTPSNRLKIQSGKFRAFVDCIEGETPHVNPEGELIQFNGDCLLSAFKTLYDFIGDDASRQWTNGILLRDQSAYATNNICLVEYWLGSTVPFTANIPMAAVREVIHINEPPTHGQLDKNSITFHYTDGRWIRSQLFSTDWPDVNKILNAQSNPKPLPENLFQGLDILKPFVDDIGRIYFEDGIIRTHTEEGLGAVYEIPEMNFRGIYQVEMLRLLKGVASTADFSLWPSASLFFGDRLRGAIIGMRL